MIALRGNHEDAWLRVLEKGWPEFVLVATNGYTDGAVPSLRRRIIPIGSYIIATERLPPDLARELSPTGRPYFDTKNFLSYWHVSADRRMIFGGRVSFDPKRPGQAPRVQQGSAMAPMKTTPYFRTRRSDR